MTRTAGSLTDDDIGSHIAVPLRGPLMNGTLTQLIPSTSPYVGLMLQREQGDTYLGLEPDDPVIVTRQEVDF